MLIGDRVVNRVPPMDRNIAMVFQNYALYPHMTVYDNIGFGLKRHKVKKGEIRTRVQAAAQMLGIEDLLSGSRRSSPAGSGSAWRWAARSSASRRVPDGRAALEPRREAARRDAGVPLHAPPAAADDHAVRHARPDRGDDDGRPRRGDARRAVEQVDNPQALYERPVNLFVGGFIGSPAMNFLRSPLTSENGALSTSRSARRVSACPTASSDSGRNSAIWTRELIVGIRPEDIEDAAFVPSANGSAFDVKVSLAEPMGSEVIAHFPIAADPILASETMVAARGGEESEDAGHLQLAAGATAARSC